MNYIGTLSHIQPIDRSSGIQTCLEADQPSGATRSSELQSPESLPSVDGTGIAIDYPGFPAESVSEATRFASAHVGS